MKVVGLFLLVVAVHITKNSALFCYNCDRVTQKKCISAIFLKSNDCPELTSRELTIGLSPICAKTILHYPNGTKHFDRGCRRNYANGTDYCADLKSQHEEAECYICATDSCNGAYQDVIRLWIFVLALIIALYIKHMAYKN